ncbi:hypothetical protein [Sorangium sp. So ce388]|uniref:hypothetical protein n=1 Tax=Sorangium sp. So ce388 TaxID=3133309 RepID=UPI003F5B4310
MSSPRAACDIRAASPRRALRAAAARASGRCARGRSALPRSPLPIAARIASDIEDVAQRVVG